MKICIFCKKEIIVSITLDNNKYGICPECKKSILKDIRKKSE